MDYIHNNRNWFLIAYVDYYNMKNGVCYFIDAFKYYLILIIGTYLYLYIFITLQFYLGCNVVKSS